jgi:hypothetical protein
MQKSDKEEHNNRVYIGRMSINRLGKFRCQNYINEFNRCRNRASKLAIIQLQQDKTPSHHQRVWICDDCFKVKFSNDDKFTDQILQVTNLSKKEE